MFVNEQLSYGPNLFNDNFLYCFQHSYVCNITLDTLSRLCCLIKYTILECIDVTTLLQETYAE